MKFFLSQSLHVVVYKRQGRERVDHIDWIERDDQLHIVIGQATQSNHSSSFAIKKSWSCLLDEEILKLTVVALLLQPERGRVNRVLKI